MKHSTLELSKFIGYILRHKPEEFYLVPDDQGWVPVQELLAVLKQQNETWSSLALADLEHLVATQEKVRYIIKGEMIRAEYGHSTPNKIRYEQSEPPSTLYHGTTPKAAQSILEQGLRPMARQYVHLSTDREVALLVAKRYTHEPVLLKVDAKRAFLEGFPFYFVNESIWLCNDLPAQFILPEEK